MLYAHSSLLHEDVEKILATPSTVVRTIATTSTLGLHSVIHQLVPSSPAGPRLARKMEGDSNLSSAYAWPPGRVDSCSMVFYVVYDVHTCLSADLTLLYLYLGNGILAAPSFTLN